MNPIKQIGRYEIPILSVLLIKKHRSLRAWLQRQSWFQRFKWLSRRRWLQPVLSYDVIMNNGQKLRFTEAEKQQYDQACEEHALIMQVYGMCKSAGLRA